MEIKKYTIIYMETFHVGSCISSITKMHYIECEPSQLKKVVDQEIGLENVWFVLEGHVENMNTDWKQKRYQHIPTGKVYKLNGSGGLIREDDSSNSSLPTWLKENSLDWKEINS